METEKVKTNKYLKPFMGKKELTEAEINLAKRRLNDKKFTSHEFYEITPEEGWKITPAQTEKGLKFLNSLRTSPTGKHRESSPYGYREDEILDKFQEFRLKEFYDDTNATQHEMGIHNHLPIYEVVGNDTSFEYYYNWKGISIIG